MTWLKPALESLRRGEYVAVATVIGPNGHSALGNALLFDAKGILIEGLAGDDEQRQEMMSQARVAVGTQTIQRFKHLTGGPDIVVIPFGPPAEAWIFGAGHIAQALSPLLARLGWDVVVCDDRVEYVTKDRFPDAARLVVESFGTCANRCAEHSFRWIVLVTRGHQHDEQILKRLTHSNPRYLGMIGSKRRFEAVRGRLEKQGVSAEFMQTIRAPIGIPIGADSPAEIAISIVAEMIAVRRGAAGHGAVGSSPVDTSHAQHLWESIISVIGDSKPAVLATIIDRRGSTPRGLGAQMAIYADGSISGTIGGGCGEEDIKQAAKRLLLTGERLHLAEVDLTSDPGSETSADVCGGRYTVMLERLA